MVERFNRTLRTKLTKYFTHINKKLWYDVLDKIINTYNNTEHGSLNTQTPVEISKTKKLDIWLNQNEPIKKSKKIHYLK